MAIDFLDYLETTVKPSFFEQIRNNSDFRKAYSASVATIIDEEMEECGEQIHISGVHIGLEEPHVMTISWRGNLKHYLDDDDYVSFTPNEAFDLLTPEQQEKEIWRINRWK